MVSSWLNWLMVSYWMIVSYWLIFSFWRALKNCQHCFKLTYQLHLFNAHCTGFGGIGKKDAVLSTLSLVSHKTTSTHILFCNSLIEQILQFLQFDQDKVYNQTSLPDIYKYIYTVCMCVYTVQLQISVVLNFHGIYLFVIKVNFHDKIFINQQPQISWTITNFWPIINNCGWLNNGCANLMPT